jgi:hypothetical protein
MSHSAISTAAFVNGWPASAWRILTSGLDVADRGAQQGREDCADEMRRRHLVFTPSGVRDFPKPWSPSSVFT